MSRLEDPPLASLPVGLCFSPTDEELMNHYLKPKIKGRIKDDSVVIPEIDVCKCEPWDLPDRCAIHWPGKSLIKSKDNEWYFFSPKVRKYPNSKSRKRATEAGYWKRRDDKIIETGPPSPIEIGHKMTLRFYCGRDPKAELTDWIMYEYRTLEPDFEKDGFVLCHLVNSKKRIREKPKKGICRRPKERILTSNNDKMDNSGFCPALTMSSPDVTVQDNDSYDKYVTLPCEGIELPSLIETGVIKDIEALLLQEDPGWEACYQLHGHMNPSSSSMPRAHNLYNELGAQSDTLYFPEFTTCELHFTNYFNGNGMIESSDASNNLIGVTDFSHDLSENEPDPSSVDNSTGIGRMTGHNGLHISENANQVGLQGMTAHGEANRRIRLQRSLHIGSDVITDGKLTTINGGHDGKAEISEYGENAEFCTYGETPTSNRATKRDFFSSFDNDELISSSYVDDAASSIEMMHPSSNNSETQNPLQEPPKATSVYFGKVTVMIPAILCVLCIGIGWFFSSQ